MRFHALAADYDDTLAHHGQVAEATIAALARLRQSGRKLLLVSGRELPDLRTVFNHLELFHLAVLENGATIYDPATQQTHVLAEPPPPAFIETLRAKSVSPLSVGHVIVATRQPHDQAVLDTIAAMSLKLQVIFNKGAVMVLPAGVNKATGLTAALAQLGLSPQNVVGVGDAENDAAFLQRCGYSVAVANALPEVKQAVDWVTNADHGAGVVELIGRMLRDQLDPET